MCCSSIGGEGYKRVGLFVFALFGDVLKRPMFLREGFKDIEKFLLGLNVLCRGDGSK